MTRIAPPPRIASRDSNPFATCWTRPGALPFVATHGVDPAVVVDRLRKVRWVGRIAGPHGAGKSTLLRRMEPAILKLGREPTWFDLTDAGFPKAMADVDSLCPGAVAMLEGFEKLSPRRRRRLLRAVVESPGGGVLVTHRDDKTLAAAPVVASLRPTIGLAERLFAELTARGKTKVSLADLREAFHRRHGNIRDVWLDLYMLHEAIERGRTPIVETAYAQ